MVRDNSPKQRQQRQLERKTNNRASYDRVLIPIHRSEVMKRLKRYFPAYEKGMGGVFGNTHAHLELAISRAEALTRKNTVNSGYEPYTNIHELVGFLISLRSGK